MKISLFDPDTVSRWNLGRQRFAAPDVGLNKATILVHRVRHFYGTDIEAHPFACELRGSNFDLLITCTDSARFRADVGRFFEKRKAETLWLDFGNGNVSAQAIFGHLGIPESGQRIPNVYDLFPQLNDMDAEDKQAPSCSMEEAVRRQPWIANRAVAVAGIALLERLILQGELTHHGSLIQLNPYTVTPLAIDPVVWSMYGYAVEAPKKRKKAA